MRQEMVIVGNEWNFGCCAERREFTIVQIFNEDKVVGIDTAGKLSLGPKKISLAQYGLRKDVHHAETGDRQQPNSGAAE
jgi:hypothetical protein